LRELFLLSTTIGPGLARGLDFDTLVSLRFRDCQGLPGFFATLVELRVQPKIKAFEIYASADITDFDSEEEELKDAVMRFLGSFSGLTDLALRLTSGPWFPKHRYGDVFSSPTRAGLRQIRNVITEAVMLEFTVNAYVDD
ncbi:hypothetical protein CEP51_016700, partial [Fusarium floridanum]